ncbi:MAG: protein-disulfide reductase DsbD family protein, partial [Betaproteobacteria bacterium]
RKVEQGVRKASLLYGLGVLLSFWALGFVVVLLQAGGEQIGWGFQLQEPGFVFAMFILFLLIGANLLGLFEVSSGFMHWAGRAEFGALGSGMLAVLVATPCTAPMMGAALGASLSQGPAQAMAVFTALAVGMALPYGALALQPQWIHRLPKPGPWMLWTRKAMAFPMFFAAVWLAWVYVLQTDLDSVLRLGFSAVCLLCACWLYGERVQSGWMRSESRRFSAAFSLGLLVLSLGLPIAGLQHDERRDLDASKQSLEPQIASAWSTWSPEAVDRALSAGEIVFIDFTAAWCVSCQVNKQLVLSTDAVSQLFETQKVRSFRGDWTKQDPRITETLSQYGRRGVPLYLVLRRDRTPQVLPEVLTYGLVRDAVLAAAAP